MPGHHRWGAALLSPEMGGSVRAALVVACYLTAGSSAGERGRGQPTDHWVLRGRNFRLARHTLALHGVSRSVREETWRGQPTKLIHVVRVLRLVERGRATALCHAARCVANSRCVWYAVGRLLGCSQ